MYERWSECDWLTVWLIVSVKLEHKKKKIIEKKNEKSQRERNGDIPLLQMAEHCSNI